MGGPNVKPHHGMPALGVGSIKNVKPRHGTPVPDAGSTKNAMLCHGMPAPDVGSIKNAKPRPRPKRNLKPGILGKS